jgi:hypothetical protein
MKVGLRITILLSQTEIDYINLVAPLANAHKEVIRLDIAVEERLRVNVLNAGDELIGKEENYFQRELAITEVEEILEARSKEI